ncbi:DUF1428 domain-containing protein [Oleiharenicola lentus]|uniref:DUF1428 domain-containing protein n=1 Tax=Oleiharenicola lentus TaxID=2508720 RepID=UPI003F66B7E6
MSVYVDGFVLSVPRKNLPAYIKMSKSAGKVWKEHGAIDYVEAVGDDLTPEGCAITFPKLAKPKPKETIVFSFITYKSRKHRDQVLKKVMKDKRITCGPDNMPFDPKRMTYGGFKSIVHL